MELQIGLVLSQLIAFIILLWVLKKFAWKPLLKVLEERKQKIQSEFDLIEVQKNEFQKLTDMYHTKLLGIEEEARRKIQEAIAEGNVIAQKIQDETHKEAKEILSKARSDAENEIAKAKIQLKGEMVNMVIMATEKLLQEKLDPKKQEKLIIDFLKEPIPQ